MASVIQNNFRVRKSFAKLKKVIEIPNLIDIQKRSYDKFLQTDVPPESARTSACRACSRASSRSRTSTRPRRSSSSRTTSRSRSTTSTSAAQRGMTFAAPIKVVIRLVVWDVDEETGAQSIRDVKEQEVYFGEIPLMTETARSSSTAPSASSSRSCTARPACSSTTTRARRTRRGKLLYTARIIPYRGSWLDFEFDHKDILYVRIDRRRKLHATVLLRALGYSTEELLELLLRHRDHPLRAGEEVLAARSTTSCSLGQRATRDITHPKTKRSPRQEEPQVHQGRDPQARGVGHRPACRSTSTSSSARSRANDVIDETTGEVLLECNEELTEAKLDELRERGVDEFEVLFIDNLNVGPYLRDTLLADKLAGPGRGDHGDLPAPAPGRSADARDRADTCSTTCSSTPSATTCRRSAA